MTKGKMTVYNKKEEEEEEEFFSISIKTCKIHKIFKRVHHQAVSTMCSSWIIIR